MTKPYQLRAIEPAVFRAYDIRGIVGKELDEDAFYTIGLALACRLQALDRSQVFLARDGRLTSQDLAQALAQALLDSGIDVLDLGEVPTPMMYYATHTQGLDSGLMVTGSHNPADYNGIKMVLAGKTLVNQDIRDLYALTEAKTRVFGQGQRSYCDFFDQYCQRILADVRLTRPLKVVVDCGNGIAGPFAPKLLADLGCEVVPLFCEVDGRFPNHHPDPSVEANLSALKAAVTQHQADLGLAFDGDADRIGLVTDRLELINPDRLIMLYAKELLARKPGAKIVYDVKCSKHLAPWIEAASGQAQICPTGHSIVKGFMKDLGAELAGEMSGHIFFKDRWYGFDDALYSACRLLEILSQSKASPAEQFDAIPNSLNTPEIKIPIAETEKFRFMERFLAEAHFPGAKIIDIDGLRVEFETGWGLLRASNTTACLVARFEADNQAELESIKAAFAAEMQRLLPGLGFPLS